MTLVLRCENCEDIHLGNSLEGVRALADIGEMALRWTAAGMLEAERQFRKVIGYRDLAKLAVAIERDRARSTPVPTPTEEAALTPA